MSPHPSPRRLFTPAVLSAGLSACLALLAGCSSGLLPAQDQRPATAFTAYDQVIDAFEDIAPGRTQEEDLPRLGFDARTGNVEVLSYLDIQTRFVPQADLGFGLLDPAVRDCILARLHCVGYVFHPSHAASRRIGNTALDILGFQRVTRTERWSADITLLVRDGLVVAKLFSGNPRTEHVENKVQPLGPLQDVGAALGRAAGSFTSF